MSRKLEQQTRQVRTEVVINADDFVTELKRYSKQPLFILCLIDLVLDNSLYTHSLELGSHGKIRILLTQYSEFCDCFRCVRWHIWSIHDSQSRSDSAKLLPQITRAAGTPRHAFSYFTTNNAIAKQSSLLSGYIRISIFDKSSNNEDSTSTISYSVIDYRGGVAIFQGNITFSKPRHQGNGQWYDSLEASICCRSEDTS